MIKRLLLTLAGAALVALVALGGVVYWGSTANAPGWTVDFDTALVQHLPPQMAPWLYRLLAQGQYKDVHARPASPTPLPPPPPTATPCPRPAVPLGTGTLDQVSVQSAALSGATRQLYVYLPPSYNLATAVCWRYPVVYLLDGWPGSAADWFTTAHAQETADRLIHDGTITETIVVGVDGNGALNNEPMWANAFDGSERDETFMWQDVVGYVDTHFRTRRDPQHRALGGLSDGGFGAGNIGLHHPEVFSGVMALSGFYQAPAKWPFGTDPAYIRAYSPLLFVTDPPVADTARHQSWLLGIGDQEGSFYADTLQLSAKMDQLGIAHTLRVWHGGHGWLEWAASLPQGLQLFDRLFRAPDGAYPTPPGPPEAWPPG